MCNFFERVAAIVIGIGAMLVVPAAFAAEYQDYRDGKCKPNQVCAIDFPKVPKGKTLTVTNLSCYLRFSYDYYLVAAQLVVMKPGGARVFAVTPGLFYQSGATVAGKSEYVYVGSEVIRATAKAGQVVRTYAQVHDDAGNLGTVSQLSCGISGTMK